MLNKHTLQYCFDQARKTASSYVFVRIDAEGIEELIVIPQRSFDEKEKFYLNAYSDDLTHVINKDVKITEVSYGDERLIPRLI